MKNKGLDKHVNADDLRFIIQNWMCTRSTVEFLGIWEYLNNPGSDRVEFDAVKIRRNHYHLEKVFDDSELEEEAVIRNFRITAADSKTYVVNLKELGYGG
ncbi:hypothetical protein AGMMS50256_22140 [Betaproteobacteria bacterium]|nr:hypothetical protein AGMMS50256_22140 [Betaproteobacteria bacterium]